ncbi:hypothetical protein [Microbulbifer sp. A4B17]|uniref:hypothetical protein n=1 Tax=Microbulbifer sp. A4B17 TaxID=359370 RepID=UPI00192DFD6D|nr:hypothetical protein [Microbulbifer sp. A4B17]
MAEDSSFQAMWQEKSEPTTSGEYIVAVRYPHGFGAYDVASWVDGQWQLGYSAEIVGWIPLAELLGGIDVGWPAQDEESFGKPFRKQFEEHRKKNPLSDTDDDDFVEFKD